LRLHELPTAQIAVIDKVDWETLSPSETQRLKEFGVDEGMTIEPLHRGLFGRGAIACRIGRMTIAMRHQHADAIHVRVGDAGGLGRAEDRPEDRIAAE
jgi:ferrous iron transport protein A